MGQGFFEKRRNDNALRQVLEIELAEGREPSIFAVQGTQEFEWSTTASIAVGVFIVLFVVAAMFGYVIYPGGLLVFAGYNSVKPRRTISLNHAVVTVWEHSFWRGKVAGAIATQRREFLELDSSVSIPGALPISLSSNEKKALAHANLQFGPAVVRSMDSPPPPAAPNPSLIDRHRVINS